MLGSATFTQLDCNPNRIQNKYEMTTKRSQDPPPGMPDGTENKQDSVSDGPKPPPDTETSAPIENRTPPTPGSAETSNTGHRLDAEALVAWLIVGLRLFSEPKSPTLADVRREAELAMMVLAMPRHGSITRAADHLGTSRRALRDKLKAAGLYPWTDARAARYRIDLDSI